MRHEHINILTQIPYVKFNLHICIKGESKKNHMI